MKEIFERIMDSSQAAHFRAYRGADRGCDSADHGVDSVFAVPRIIEEFLKLCSSYHEEPSSASPGAQAHQDAEN